MKKGCPYHDWAKGLVECMSTNSRMAINRHIQYLPSPHICLLGSFEWHCRILTKPALTQKHLWSTTSCTSQKLVKYYVCCSQYYVCKKLVACASSFCINTFLKMKLCSLKQKLFVWLFLKHHDSLSIVLYYSNSFLAWGLHTSPQGWASDVFTQFSRLSVSLLWAELCK